MVKQTALALGLLTLVPGSVDARKQNKQKTKIQWVDTGEYKRVFLASHPRSGNHWAKFLIEEATGIASGAVRCSPDPQHLSNPFPWGGYGLQGGLEGRHRMPAIDDVIMVKTHYPIAQQSPFERDKLQPVVRLLRFPFDSIRSDFYINNDGNHRKKDWNKVIRRAAVRWKEFQEYWDAQPEVLTIRYEEMLAEPAYWLRVICEHFGMSVNKEDIARSVAKYPPFGTPGKHMKYFSQSDITDLMAVFGAQVEEYGYGDLFSKMFDEVSN